ncbi:MAG: ribosomal-protein-S5-alanine N-acetyltransferase [Firmicutes bacterium ADurb.Bin182]|nr:MAG: ribosomal-protein-S5-alanine N-acetyltransferase [Firmicutes bacterium ADurb.Bin182]
MLTHKGTQTIYTDRLILRKFRHEDAEPMFYNWASDSDVCRYITWPAHEDIEVTKSVIEKVIGGYEAETTYNWAMELKKLGEPIGSISVVMIGENSGWCEIGYCMGKKYWNKGIMSEALSAVMDFLFNKVGFHRIQARHDTDNPASGKVMQKCGMQFEGIMKEATLQKSGRHGDLAMYGIINPAGRQD